MASTVNYNSLSFLRYPAPLPPSNMLSVYATATPRRPLTATVGRLSKARQTTMGPNNNNNNNNGALFGVVSSTGTVSNYNSNTGTFRNKTPSRWASPRPLTGFNKSTSRKGHTTSNPCNETNTNNEYLFGQQMQNGHFQKYNNKGNPCPPKNNHRTAQPFSLPSPPRQFRGNTVKKSTYPSDCQNNLILGEGNPMNSVNSSNEYHTNNLWRYTNQGWKCKKNILGATRAYLNQRKKPTWRQKLKQTLKNFKTTIVNKFRTNKKK